MSVERLPFEFADHPSCLMIERLRAQARELGIPTPYCQVSEGMARATIRIDGREYLNFANYDFLDLASHPAVIQAAKDAIDRYGTSVSASRLISGERPIHRELEREIADFLGTQDCLVFVSGYLTNLTTIAHLYGPRDLVVHDALAHNSVIHGAMYSRARRASFPHNDWEALDKLLTASRSRHKRALIVLEGLYSMDGDYPDLPRFIEVKRRHNAQLMVDEAHSFGVLGQRGGGIREHFGIAAEDIDIWMGTLSKALASCGGYIAGSGELIDCLRHSAPGFVFSVGVPPGSAAAALAALRILKAEPRRVEDLRARSQLFLECAQARGLRTGTSRGFSVVPVITGSSQSAVRLSSALAAGGINVHPIIFPAVKEEAARLRFILTCAHTEEQIRHAVDLTARKQAEIQDV
jgi:8-amino-7-oxononanoate synthase